MKKAQNIYDNSTFYNEYRSMRESELNANNLIEIPIIKSMLPSLKNKKILDLGCGNGSMSRYSIENGASEVLAIDISLNMINEAKEKNNLKGIRYEVMGMEDISNINQKFDFIFSSLAFHYIEDFDKLMSDCHNLLNKEGILLFSQEHPLTLAPILENDMKKYMEKNGKRYYYVSDYNNEGIRKVFWNVNDVVKYHRNMSTLINDIVNNKLSILEVKESYASKEAIQLVDKYKYQKDRPYFLFIKAIKK